MKEEFEEDLKLKELKELKAIKKILLENQTIMKDIFKAVNSDKNRKTISKTNENHFVEEAEGYIDPLFGDAVEFAIKLGKISASSIQRKFKIGYARASRLIDKMEENEIISEFQATKPRKVLISKEEWEKIKEKN